MKLTAGGSRPQLIAGVGPTEPMLDLNSVFSLGAPATGRGAARARRARLQGTIGSTLDAGLVPLLVGEYGVGKTTLAHQALRDVPTAGPIINIENARNQSLESILLRCLDEIGVEEAASHSSSGGSETKLSLGAGVSITGLKLALGRDDTSSSSTTSTWSSSRLGQLHQAVCLLNRSKATLIVDELHRASEDFLEDLAAFIKSVYNSSDRTTRIVLVGTGSDATTLVRSDPGINRLLVEVEVPALPHAECLAFLDQAFTSLAIRANPETLTLLAARAAGSPSVLQHIAYEVARSAITREPRVAVTADVDAAMELYVERFGARLSRAYHEAIETRGTKQLRKNVLFCLAHTEAQFLSTRDLAGKVSRLLRLRGHRASTSTASLAKPLSQLKSEEFGSLLADVVRPNGSRLRSHVTIRDPAMKAFIRMVDPLLTRDRLGVVLSPRQLEVAELAAVGATVTEIASTLQSSIETVRSHLKEVYRRLDVSSRAELSRILANPSAALTREAVQQTGED